MQQGVEAVWSSGSRVNVSKIVGQLSCVVSYCFDFMWLPNLVSWQDLACGM